MIHIMDTNSEEYRLDLINQCSTFEERQALVKSGFTDAITNLPITDLAFMEIMVDTNIDGLDNFNVVPCNTELKLSKGNEDFYTWFYNSKYYTRSGYKRVEEWLGDYSRLLPIPVIQRKYIDITDPNIRYFTLFLPDGSRKRLYYCYNSGVQHRVDILNDEILDDWEEYFNSCWLHFGKKDTFRKNKEDRVRDTLEKCGTYLIVHSHSNTDKVMNKTSIDNIIENELPISSCSKEIQDQYYGICSFAEDDSCGNEIVEEIDYDLLDSTPTPKKWEDTTVYKYDALFRDGIIDENEPFISSWCLVNTNNEFEFEGKIFTISEDVEQYQPREDIAYFDDYTDSYAMDKVLVFYQYGTYILLDENLDIFDMFQLTNGMKVYKP